MDKKIIIAAAAVLVILLAVVGGVILMKGGSGDDVEYTLTYVTNGGDEIAPVKFTEKQEISLPTPTKANSTFLGWYDNAQFNGDKIFSIAKGTAKNVTLYAKWSMVTNGIPSAEDFAANTSITANFAKDAPASEQKVSGSVINAITAGKELTVTNTDGSKTTLAWTFNGSSSTQAGYVAGTPVSTVVTPSFDEGKKEVTLDFDYDGTLPYESTIKYYVGDHFSAGEKVSIKNSGDSEAIGVYTVDSQGYVTFTITHCSDWVLSYYVEVTFNAADGKFADGSTTKTFGGNYNTPLSATDLDAIAGVYRAGYSVSWNPAFDPASAKYVAGTYAAVYTAVPYTVTFDANGGFGSMSSQEFVYDADNVALSENLFTRNHYVFAGWNSKADGTGTSYSDKQPVRNLYENGQGITLYAQWTPVEYTVTYHANGGTVPSATVKYTIETSGLALATPVREGATFAAWYKAADLSGEAVSTIEPGLYGDFDVYAKWDLTEYTIRFINNGGSAVDPVKFTVETAADLPASTKDGSAFGGWYADEACSGEPVYKIVLGTIGDKTYYAKWTPYAVNVVTALDGTSIYDGLRELSITNSSSERAVMQKTVAGTFRIESSDSYSIVIGQTYAVSDASGNVLGNITVDESGLGSLTVNYWTVSFDSNGGTAVDPQILLNNTNAVAPTVPARSGYDFAAWKNGSSVYDFSTPVTGIVELIAAWNATSYTISFETVGGSAVESISYDITKEVTISALSSMEGFTFKGWYDNRGYTGEAVTQIAKGTTGDITLFAKWEGQKYTATIVLPSVLAEVEGTVGQGWINPLLNYQKEFEYGTSVEAIVRDFGATFSLDAYEFTGWDPSTGFIGTEGITINAVMTAKHYTVVFNTNGGTGDVVPIRDVTVETDIELPAYSGTRTGYNFGNAWGYLEIWNSITGGITTDCHRLSATFVEDFAENGTVTLYAKWDAINYTVRFDANSGTGSVPDALTNVHLGTDISVPESTLTKAGKFFGGWNTKSDGTGTTFRGYTSASADLVQFVDGTTVTLYAKWVDAIYSATKGDVFSYTLTYINDGGRNVDYHAQAFVVNVAPNEYFLETHEGNEELEAYERYDAGYYPDIFGSPYLDAIHATQGVHDTMTYTYNGASITVDVTVYNYSGSGGTYILKETADGLILYYEFQFNVTGNSVHGSYTMTSIAIGSGNGYDPATAYAVTYYSGTQDGATSVSASSSTYKTPSELGMSAPEGKVFAGWVIDKDTYEFLIPQVIYTSDFIVVSSRSVYAIWEDYVPPETNIDWVIQNLPAGMSVVINGEDAYSANGTVGDYIDFEGATNWSYADGKYTFTVGGKTYHASVEEEFRAIVDGQADYISNVEDTPTDGKMRIRLMEKAANMCYHVEVQFWQDDVYLNGYIVHVGDVFVYEKNGTRYTVNVTSFTAGDTVYDYTVNGGESTGTNLYKYPTIRGMVYPDLDLDYYLVETVTIDGVQYYHFYQKAFTHTNYDGYSTESDGFTFSAYYTVEDGIFHHGSDITLISKPDDLGSASYVQITYDGNGGTVYGPSYREYEVNNWLASKRGSQLVGWNTMADESGRTFVEGDHIPYELTDNGRITLYAMWAFAGAHIEATLPNGQVVRADQEEHKYESDVWFPGMLDLSPIDGQAATYFSIADSINVPKVSIRVYDSGYEVRAADDGTYTICGSSSNLASNLTKVNGQEVYYKVYDYSSYGAPSYMNYIEIYAAFDAHIPLAVTYDEAVPITYHGNYGSDATVTKLVPVHGYFNMPTDELFSRSGYQLLGWLATDDPEDDEVIACGNELFGERLVEAEITQFYASWVGVMTLHFDANGAEGEIGNRG